MTVRVKSQYVVRSCCRVEGCAAYALGKLIAVVRGAGSSVTLGRRIGRRSVVILNVLLVCEGTSSFNVTFRHSLSISMLAQKRLELVYLASGTLAGI